MLKKKKKGSIMENMIVMLLNMILLCAFLVIIFGAFAGISDKWGMRQVAREYTLIMETEGFLKPSDQASYFPCGNHHERSGLWKQNFPLYKRKI